MSARTVQILIEGVVQGVGFRWWTVQTAQRLGVDGWVRNLHDGRVEVLARGPADRIDALAAACHDGPAAATVDRVEVTDTRAEVPSGFQQRPTV